MAALMATRLLVTRTTTRRQSTCPRMDALIGYASRVIRLTFFHSAATCLHLPTRLTRKSTKREGRKPRTSERHVVGCCEVLARARQNARVLGNVLKNHANCG